MKRRGGGGRSGGGNEEEEEEEEKEGVNVGVGKVVELVLLAARRWKIWNSEWKNDFWE